MFREQHFPPAYASITHHDFERTLAASGLDSRAERIETLQVNLTRLCNQACLHCHVEASPKRTEQMDTRTVDRCLEILCSIDGIRTLDLTGGAPELHPEFGRIVKAAKALGKHVMVRHNLTVTLDGHPVTGEPMRHLPEFFADHDVEVVSSLPHYQQYFTDRQRGRGVYEKSITSLKLLNTCGYGEDGGNRILDLVYNPNGTFLPGDQTTLEQEYKRSLREQHGIVFTRLFTITNMPIKRFLEQLVRNGHLDEYMDRLVAAYNPAAAAGIMCRSLVSVGHDGTIHDCDFNQMLDLPVNPPASRSVFDEDIPSLATRSIAFGPHCFGCTAGAGSSCGGALE
jgi:radical SAM/Cys-rich protein